MKRVAIKVKVLFCAKVFSQRVIVAGAAKRASQRLRKIFLPAHRASEYRPRSPSQIPAKQLAKPSGQLIGPPKIDNADEIVAASSETKLSRMIAVAAKSVGVIMDRLHAAFGCSAWYLRVEGAMPNPAGTGIFISSHITAINA